MDIALMRKDLDVIAQDVAQIKGRIDGFGKVAQDLALTTNATSSLQAQINELRMEKVSKAEFWPVKTIVYGWVSLLLSGIVLALLALILKAGVPG